jgi:hypothetical protein
MKKKQQKTTKKQTNKQTNKQTKKKQNKTEINICPIHKQFDTICIEFLVTSIGIYA